MKCPAPGCFSDDAYVGFTSVLCDNMFCRFYDEEHSKQVYASKPAYEELAPIKEEVTVPNICVNGLNWPLYSCNDDQD